MNTYKITAVVNDTGREITDTVTEANENAAKKDFRVIYRHAGQFTITDVELVKDDVSASKQQERDAIEKIRAILETLGPNSYTVTALEGCLEIADQNVEYDFADSMKGRAESAKKEAEHFRDAANHFSAEADKANAKVEELQQQVEALQKKILDDDDLIDCIALVKDKHSEYVERMEQAASEIVVHADATGSKEFQQAVASHRSAKSDCEYYSNLANRLEAAK